MADKVDLKGSRFVFWSESIDSPKLQPVASSAQRPTPPPGTQVIYGDLDSVFFIPPPDRVPPKGDSIAIPMNQLSFGKKSYMVAK
jgi:hypothetical protein